MCAYRWVCYVLFIIHLSTSMTDTTQQKHKFLLCYYCVITLLHTLNCLLCMIHPCWLICTDLNYMFYTSFLMFSNCLNPTKQHMYINAPASYVILLTFVHIWPNMHSILYILYLHPVYVMIHKPQYTHLFRSHVTIIISSNFSLLP